MIGDTLDAGRITFNNTTYQANLLDSKPEFKDIWYVDYDDSTTPVTNVVYPTPFHLTSDGKKPDRQESLTADEITWWSNWVPTEFNRIHDEKHAAEAAVQRTADEELVAKFDNWQTNGNNKTTRDNLLIISDAYEMLDHLKSAGWSEWRQWLRDLPETSPDPLNIPFQDPPANANARVLKSFNNWKQRLGVAKGVKENL